MQLDRRHVIASGVAAFIAWAYLTDWVPSLRWIPYAFAIGFTCAVLGTIAVLLTTSKGIHTPHDASRNRAPVAPAFTSAQAWEEEKAALRSRAEYRRPMIFPQAVLFSSAVDNLLDLIIRDRVTSWYAAISKRSLFQNEIDRCIRSVLLALAARMTNIDLVEIGVADVLPIVTGHLKEFYDAERAVGGRDLSDQVTEGLELDMGIARKYQNGRMHPVASLESTDTTVMQQQYFRTLIAKLLPPLLPDNMKSSPSVLVLIREIVACAVLTPVITLLTDPDTWNQLIVNIGGPMLQDRKAVRKIRAALDENAPVSPHTIKGMHLPRLKPYDTERHFERFIRAVRNVGNLPDARKLRSELISQIRQASSVEGQDLTYLRRLETGRRLLEEKISRLATDSAPKPTLSVSSMNLNGDAVKHISSPLSPDGLSSRDTSPVAARRPQLAPVHKESELRRAVLSSSNLKDSIKATSTMTNGRRSLDDNSVRASLFGDDLDDDRMAQSQTSIQSADSDGESVQQEQEATKAVNAMQEALDGIIKEEKRAPLFGDSPDLQSTNNIEPNTKINGTLTSPSARSSLDATRPTLPASSSDLGKPSIASLGLVGGPSSRGVFVDDLFGHETQKFVEDEREDSGAPYQSDEDPVQEAAPGDLGLIEAIDALNADIERLTAQRQVLDSLTAKAELTNNIAELRILRKSEQSLQRETKRKEMQKQQYIVQESDNSLYGRAAVNIKSVMIGKEDDGHEYALYVIEVRRQAGEQMSAATWAITRRYSQFHELHKRLRARFPSVRELDFPRRQALFTLQKDFVQKRRITLERYLRSLLLVPAICRSRELRAFLSQSSIGPGGTKGSQVDTKDFVTRIYNSVSDGMEEFLGNTPVLDQLSTAGQNLISAGTSQMQATTPAVERLDPAVHEPSTAAEAEAELNAYEAKEAEPFVKPICDLFLETFELSKGNNWLRGRTVVVVLHQLLGGTIERKVRENLNHAIEDESLVRYVNLLKDTLWPGGIARPAAVIRTAAEKARSSKEASLVLGALIPDVAGSVVGRANAQAASRKICAALNNQRLNTHILFTLIDEVVTTVFPETLDK